MLRHILLGASLSCALFLSTPAFAQRADNTVKQSYLNSFGRNPSDGEVKYWMGRGDWQTQDDLIKFHLMGLQSNAGLQQEAVTNAFARAGVSPAGNVLELWKKQLAQQPRRFDVLSREVKSWVDSRSRMISDSYQEALGRAPSADETKYWLTRLDFNSKNDLVNLHRQGIKTNAALGDEVITNSYKRAFLRNPDAGEYNHWRQHAKLGWTCQEMVNEHEKWKRNNPVVALGNEALKQQMRRQGLAFDTVGNIVKLDQATADKIRSTNASPIVAAGGGNIVAAGGGNIVAAGGGNIVAAGGGNIVAAGGGNVIARAGSYIVAAGGGNIVAAGGGNIVAAGGGN